MPGKRGKYIVPVVVIQQLIRALWHPPCVVGQFCKALTVCLRVIPGVPHYIFMDIQGSLPVPFVCELLDPFASCIYMLLLILQLSVSFRKYHQVVILKAGVVDHVIAGIYFSGMGGLGIINAQA